MKLKLSEINSMKKRLQRNNLNDGRQPQTYFKSRNRRGSDCRSFFASGEFKGFYWTAKSNGQSSSLFAGGEKKKRTHRTYPFFRPARTRQNFFSLHYCPRNGRAAFLNERPRH